MPEDRMRKDRNPDAAEVGSMETIADTGSGEQTHYEQDERQIVRAVHQRRFEGPLPIDEVSTDAAERPQPAVPVQDARVTPPGPSVWEATPATEDEMRKQRPLRWRLDQG